jgi:glyceraldehyde 3-phosphate dehydrogenase/D-erythrose 4-phosphate dehydrogenase
MTYRVAINGYGRIGQSVLRAYYESRLSGTTTYPFQIVAINELSDIDTIAYLTRYDTTHGRFPLKVEVEGPSTLSIDGDQILVVRHEDASELPWSELKIDLVLECTGAFSTHNLASKHISSGASCVLISQPGDESIDKTIVYGFNHEEITGSESIISNASCTTNAILPLIDILNQAYSIEYGSLTTIHSAMNDQPTIDAYHHHDLRRTRSAMQNVVPVETELAKGIERFMPEMKGRLMATALRVPVINVSAIDLSVMVAVETSQIKVNRLLQEKASSDMFNMLAYIDQPLASSDFIHEIHSTVIDASQTRVVGGKLIKLLTWFDNEWAYANRMLDVAAYWLSKKNIH